MKNVSLSFGIAALASLLASCAGQSAVVPSAGSPLAPALTPIVQPDTAPPACKGQKKTKQYATATETLSKKGGALCIPGFGGFGGTIVYPHVTASTKIAVISSTTNYANVPLPISGTKMPIFYLNLALSGNTNFTTKIGTGGGLAGKGIKAKQSYTAYVLGYQNPFWHGPLSSCYAVATSGKYGGTISGLGVLLKGISDYGFSGYNPFEIFIYTGQMSSTKC